MATKWFCRIMGEEWGPMSAREFVAVARLGRLTRDDVVRRGATGTWVRAEIVDGLFIRPAPASTVTSHRVAIARQQAKPAKRSVGNGRPVQFWVSDGQKTVGPFSGPRLRQLAAEGILKPTDLVRSNRSGWVRAAQVKGIDFWGVSPLIPTILSGAAVRPQDQPSPSPPPSPPPSPDGQSTDNADAQFDDLVLS